MINRCLYELIKHKKKKRFTIFINIWNNFSKNYTWIFFKICIEVIGVAWPYALQLYHSPTRWEISGGPTLMIMILQRGLIPLFPNKTLRWRFTPSNNSPYSFNTYPRQIISIQYSTDTYVHNSFDYTTSVWANYLIPPPFISIFF